MKDLDATAQQMVETWLSSSTPGRGHHTNLSKIDSYIAGFRAGYAHREDVSFANQATLIKHLRAELAEAKQEIEQYITQARLMKKSIDEYRADLSASHDERVRLQGQVNIAKSALEKIRE